MKIDQNKSLAENVIEVFAKVRDKRGWRGLKQWEEGLLEKAEDELKYPPSCDVCDEEYELRRDAEDAARRFTS